ncbi:MAG: MBL fold metallo-hydrolase [Chloroflexi bacterium]|nr:MBL fold metallo-hydrolase [Chloroflexota bacterium]
MEITWLGHSCFRIRSREVTIITDPYDKTVGYSWGRPTANIVTVSHDHPDHNNIAGVGGSPYVVAGPGEYEIANVFITGIRTYHDVESGKSRGNNTVYLLEMDDIKLCHLGDLGHIPTTDQIEVMSDVDILMIPVGGGPTLNATTGAEAVSLLGPKIVIPMHYKTPATSLPLEPVERFLKEMAIKDFAPQEKLVATKGTIPLVTQVVVLDYRR